MTSFTATTEELKAIISNRHDASNFQHAGTIHEIIKSVNIVPSEGVHVAEVPERRKRFGSNDSPRKLGNSLLALVAFTLVRNVSLIVLLILWSATALILSVVLDPSEGIYGLIEVGSAVVGVLLLALVKTRMQSCTEQRLRALKVQADANRVRVIRDGTYSMVEKQELVVGDVACIQVGDIIEADGVLIESDQLKINERPIFEDPAIAEKDTYNNPIVLSGTSVHEGCGKFLVLAVGINLHQAPREVPAEPTKQSMLTQKLKLMDERVKRAAYFAALITLLGMGIRFGIEYAMAKSIWESKIHLREIVNWFITSITVLAISMPYGAANLVNLALSLCVHKMQKRGNLVRHLHAVEMMGATTCILAETSTMTKSKASVVRAYIAHAIHKSESTWTCAQSMGFQLRECKEFLTLVCHNIALTKTDASIMKKGDGSWKQTGSITDCALLQFASDLNFNYRVIRDSMESKPVKVYPFSSERMRSGYALQVGPPGSEQYRLYMKGEAEVIISLCTAQRDPEGNEWELSESNRVDLFNVMNDFASLSLHCIAIAVRNFEGLPSWEKQVQRQSALRGSGMDTVYAAETQLTFLCMLGVETPLQKAVPVAVERCKSAGVDVRLVTADSFGTAVAIGNKCGILRNITDVQSNGSQARGATALTGIELRDAVLDADGSIIESDFDKVWPYLRVVARCSYHDKYLLTRGISDSVVHETQIGRECHVYPDRQVVAVTGDGVNDALALKHADIGFAMGTKGTAVARATADIILVNDNFSSTVDAILWGRNLYDCIAKFLQFQLSGTVVVMFLVLITTLFLTESPLTTIQFMWVTMILNPIGVLALASEAPVERLLDRPPYGRVSSLITFHMGANMVGHAIYQLIVVNIILFEGAGAVGTGAVSSWEKGGFLNVQSGSKRGAGAAPTMHYTVLFNTLVLMQLANWLNARKLCHELNPFVGLSKNLTFCVLWIIVAGVQVGCILVGKAHEYAQLFFHTVPLLPQHWLWCIGFAVGELIWQWVIIFIVRFVYPSEPQKDPKSVTLYKRVTVNMQDTHVHVHTENNQNVEPMAGMSAMRVPYTRQKQSIFSADTRASYPSTMRSGSIANSRLTDLESQSAVPQNRLGSPTQAFRTRGSENKKVSISLPMSESSVDSQPIVRQRDVDLEMPSSTDEEIDGSSTEPSPSEKKGADQATGDELFGHADKSILLRPLPVFPSSQQNIKDSRSAANDQPYPPRHRRRHKGSSDNGSSPRPSKHRRHEAQWDEHNHNNDRAAQRAEPCRAPQRKRSSRSSDPFQCDRQPPCGALENDGDEQQHQQKTRASMLSQEVRSSGPADHVHREHESVDMEDDDNSQQQQETLTLRMPQQAWSFGSADHVQREHDCDEMEDGSDNHQQQQQEARPSRSPSQTRSSRSMQQVQAGGSSNPFYEQHHRGDMKNDSDNQQEKQNAGNGEGSGSRQARGSASPFRLDAGETDMGRKPAPRNPHKTPRSPWRDPRREKRLPRLRSAAPVTPGSFPRIPEPSVAKVVKYDKGKADRHEAATNAYEFTKKKQMPQGIHVLRGEVLKNMEENGTKSKKKGPTKEEPSEELKKEEPFSVAQFFSEQPVKLNKEITRFSEMFPRKPIAVSEPTSPRPKVRASKQREVHPDLGYWQHMGEELEKNEARNRRKAEREKENKRQEELRRQSRLRKFHVTPLHQPEIEALCSSSDADRGQREMEARRRHGDANLRRLGMGAHRRVGDSDRRQPEKEARRERSDGGLRQPDVGDHRQRGDADHKRHHDLPASLQADLDTNESSPRPDAHHHAPLRSRSPRAKARAEHRLPHAGGRREHSSPKKAKKGSTVHIKLPKEAPPREPASWEFAREEPKRLEDFDLKHRHKLAQREDPILWR